MWITSPESILRISNIVCGLILYLELAGFRSAALIQVFDLRYNLISALVKWWYQETHTFHFLCEECTIALEDVALQLGLTIYRSAVTGVSTIFESVVLYYILLGVLPGDAESEFTGLQFSKMKVNFKHLQSIPIEQEYISASPGELGKIHGINKRGKQGLNWAVTDQQYIAVRNNQMGQRPHMDLYFYLEPSLEYIQCPLSPQYSTPPEQTFGVYDFSTMFSTP
ncbi:hypothetical protein J1N35_040936 [Gossypium stocksii]|uniref:Aminotransferase-like plant mobile domain-containing protein n=1 Tax=Gossypium stocksii TaxID=47602 RepID=A0A9D3ZIZ2_9ROSI|nr:hypothetical protein J1N35_040936 [Gossypium stocksii]